MSEQKRQVRAIADKLFFSITPRPAKTAMFSDLTKDLTFKQVRAACCIVTGQTGLPTAFVRWLGGAWSGTSPGCHRVPLHGWRR